MGSMRQRLLLVAGWAAAAVVASLVSTGAVAVAGGQVTDQPLAPLSASEVAALTEENVGRPNERLASGSSEDLDGPTTTVLAAPTTNSSQDGDENGVSPSSPVDATAGLAPEDPLDPRIETDESLLLPESGTVPAPGAEVVELVGGRVSVAGADGVVTIIWMIPSPGFALLPPTRPEAADNAVTLVFSDGTHRSTLLAEWSDEEGLLIEVIEGGVGRSD